jgi:hypothetical protein
MKVSIFFLCFSPSHFAARNMGEGKGMTNLPAAFPDKKMFLIEFSQQPFLLTEGPKCRHGTNRQPAKYIEFPFPKKSTSLSLCLLPFGRCRKVDSGENGQGEERILANGEKRGGKGGN